MSAQADERGKNTYRLFVGIFGREEEKEGQNLQMRISMTSFHWQEGYHATYGY